MRILFPLSICLVATTVVKATESPELLRKEIASLRASDAAWKKISWQPCLLRGLQQSREHEKPIVAWIFIDRPVDDKRC